SLDLSGTGITSLPDNFSCESLYLEPRSISNVTYRENCGYSSRTIFAVWTRDNFYIAAGCFFNTLERFEEAVNDSYDGDAAEGYKRAAHECINELALKLNK
ncbi:hypothetical protein QUQ16_001108, partial [Escherichia coli]|nr:hypothetical protein [Escherichia coli]